MISASRYCGFDHGNNCTPGFSIIVSGNHATSNSRTNCAIITPSICITSIRTPRTAPPTIIPNLFAANMKPLTLATSSGCKISTASASVATSCNDENILWMNNTLVTNLISPFRSGINNNPPKVSAIPV